MRLRVHLTTIMGVSILILGTLNAVERPAELEAMTWSLGSNVAVWGTQGGLTKTSGGSSAWNGDAECYSHSVQHDGRVFFRAETGSHLAVGLSLINKSASYTDLEYAILVRSDGTSRVYEGGTLRLVIGAYTATTEFEIRRSGEKIEYLKDGTVVYTSSVTAVGNLKVDTSFYKLGSVLLEAYVFDGDLDNDGMPDSWESAQLPPNHNWDDILLYDEENDADDDGEKSLQEYLDGTDPQQALDYLQPVQWINAVGTQSVGLDGGIEKTSTTSGWNADANSDQVILANGKLVFKAPDGSNIIVGLTSSNDSRSNTDLEYAIQLTTSNKATGRRPESTTNIALGDYTSDTVFAIQRVSGKVNYIKDGVIIYTSTKPSSDPLIADCSLNAVGSTITLARIQTDDLDEDGMPDSWESRYLGANPTLLDLQAFEPLGHADGDGISNLEEYYEGTNPTVTLAYQADVVWVPSSTTNVSVGAGGNAKKIAGGTAWTNADAVATKVVEHSGSVTFTVASPSYLGVGFTHSDDSRSYSDLEYCIRVNSSNVAHVYEGTAQRAVLGSYNEFTRFSIRRVGGLIEYLKDGVVYYTSAVPVSGPLLLDCSFYTKDSEVAIARLYTGDLDEDSMADEWELTQLQRLSPGLAFTLENLEDDFLPSDDADEDGFENLEEFKHGTDPLQQISMPYAVSWTELTKTTALTSGGLKKTSGTAAYNADGITNESLANDGIFTFSVTGTGTMAVGLTYQNDSRAVADLEYAFTFASSDAKIKRPESTSNLAIGEYTSDTVFGIRRHGSVVEYLKDGVVLLSSTTPSEGALYADCAIYTLNNEISTAFFHSDDVDGDGLPDEWELQLLPLNATYAQIAALLPDSDGPDNDDVNLLQEYQAGTSPLLADTDGDGMPDSWEIFYDLAATHPGNAFTDADNDGLTNLEEYLAGTNPNLPDTDGDGMPDKYEIVYELQPTVDDGAGDVDGDALSNLLEYNLNSDPTDYFEQGGSRIVPELAIVSGNLQTGLASAFTSDPIVISIQNSETQSILVNAPITFSVVDGDGLISISSSGTPAPEAIVQTRSDTNGLAAVYVEQPAEQLSETALTVTADVVTLSGIKVTTTLPILMRNSRVACGSYTANVVAYDGTVWSFGDNSGGLLGDGTNQQRLKPVQAIGVEGAIAVASGSDHTLILNADGSVWGMGSEYGGKLGGLTTTNQYTAGEIQDLSNVVAVAAGLNHSAVLKSDGTVWTFGVNDVGQLGDGTTINKSSPVQVIGLSNVVAIEAGNMHTVALKDDGTVWAFGENNAGQLGDGTTLNRSLPVQVSGVNNAVMVCATEDHTSILRNDGSVWYVGNNIQNVLGGTSVQTTPYKIPDLEKIIYIDAAPGELVVINKDKNLWKTSTIGFEQLDVDKDMVAVLAGCLIMTESNGNLWRKSNGVNSWDMGLEQFPLYETAPLEVGTVSDVVSAAGQTYIVRKDGTVWKTDIDAPSFSQIEGLNSVESISSQGHTLFLKTDGSLWGLGLNTHGQLGDGTTLDKTVPTRIASLSGVKKAVAGGSHSVILKTDGTVWTFGSNSSGQLGDGSNVDRLLPIQVSGLTDVIDIAAGSNHTVIVKADGTVWAWGANDRCQIAEYATSSSSVPIQVSITGVKSVSAAHWHNIVVTNSGEVWGWGDSTYGQAGGSSWGYEFPPIKSNISAIIKTVSTGEYHTMALDADGGVWTFGNGWYGQSGNGTLDEAVYPTRLALEHVVAISAGALHSVAVKEDGFLVTWGATDSGKLGGVGVIGSGIYPYYGLNVLSEPPTVALDSLVTELTVILGSAVTLTAEVGAGSDTPSSVHFYHHGVLVGADDEAPFTVDFMPWSWGSFDITAVATNSSGCFSKFTELVKVNVPYDCEPDGLPDWWELKLLGSLNLDGTIDSDGDGLTNAQEYAEGTDPAKIDTDDDGLADGAEISIGTNPLIADSDGDGYSDGLEVQEGTDPLNSENSSALVQLNIYTRLE